MHLKGMVVYHREGGREIRVGGCNSCGGTGGVLQKGWKTMNPKPRGRSEGGCADLSCIAKGGFKIPNSPPGNK